MAAPHFSPCGQQLIVPWELDRIEEDVLLEIYSTTSSALITSLHAPLSGAYDRLNTVVFQPNGHHFAAPRPDGFVLFDSKSYQMQVHMSPDGAVNDIVCLAFSPNSETLFRYRAKTQQQSWNCLR